MTHRVWHDAYDVGVPPEIGPLDRPLPAFLEASARDYPEATALIFLNRRITYRELKDHVDRLAAAFVRLGVERGTRVAILLPNLPQTVIAFHAVLATGATVVMTNPLYVEREIEYQWRDAGCSVAVVTDYLWARRLSAIRDRLPIEHYIVTSIPEYLRFPRNILARVALGLHHPPMAAPVHQTSAVHLFRVLVHDTPPERPDRSIAMDDVAALQYTGGTTGVPKGAMLTHRNLAANAQQLASWFVGAKPGHEVMLGALPFFHVFGLTVAMNYPVLIAAANVIIPDPRDIRRIVANTARHRVTLFPAVPAMFNAILEDPRRRSVDLTSVTACFSGAAPLPPDVLERFEALTGSRIVEGYGLTEASPVTHVNPLFGRRKIGSVGVPCPGTDMKIVSLEDGATEVAVGTAGELLVKGPQVMRGYWKSPEASADVLADGWLRTGDIATVDAEGYTFIAGRKKDLIIASGYNIYPDEIDAVLAAHPAVLESATIGVPDARRGETVKSFVVTRPGQATTEAELIAYCRRELAPYKVPRSIEFLRELPKGSTLKVLRRELRRRSR
jgi:long-chain acyl-CoA synthetase